MTGGTTSIRPSNSSTNAANYTVEHGRTDDGYRILNKSTIHDRVYHDLRGETDLPANLCVRAYSKAVESIKSTVADWKRAIADHSLGSENPRRCTTNAR